MSVKDQETNALPECCRPVTERKGQGFLWGLFYGLVPHTFCILFIVLSVVGATAASSFVSRILFVPYLFQIIVALSLVFATISAIFYLRRNGLLSRAGVQRKWRYLSIMYGTTLAINLLFFWVIFPAVANLDLPAAAAAPTTVNASAVAGPRAGCCAAPAAVPVAPRAGCCAAPAAGGADQAAGSGNTAAAPIPANLKATTLAVDIPCAGHAPLIIGELKKIPGIKSVKYGSPNLFQVSYDASVTSVDQILAQEVFKAFPAEVRS